MLPPLKFTLPVTLMKNTSEAEPWNRQFAAVEGQAGDVDHVGALPLPLRVVVEPLPPMEALVGLGGHEAGDGRSEAASTLLMAEAKFWVTTVPPVGVGDARCSNR